jgi:hypothetical protein
METRDDMMIVIVRTFLTVELLKQYEQKKVEFETPDRTYCSNPLCSAFIRREDITNERATCPDCRAVICTTCKAPSHEDDCPADIGLQQALQTADENGWQRYYSSDSNEGCYNRQPTKLDINSVCRPWHVKSCWNR